MTASGFCVFPHGPSTVFPSVLALVGFTLSVSVLLVCDFVNMQSTTEFFVRTTMGTGNNTENIVDRDYSIDSFRFVSLSNRPDACGDDSNFYSAAGAFEFRIDRDIPIDDDEARPNNPLHWRFDQDYSTSSVAIFRAAYGLAGGATILGAIAVLFLWFSTCVSFRRGQFVMLSFMFALAAVCQILTLVVFSADACQSTCSSEVLQPDDENMEPTAAPVDGVTEAPTLEPLPDPDECHEGCNLGVGAGLAIAAFLLWAVTACSVVALPVPDDDSDAASSPQEKQALVGASESNEGEGINTDEDGNPYQTTVSTDANGNQVITRTYMADA